MIRALLLTFSIALLALPAFAKPRLILDSDTANEIDDLYTFARQEKLGRLGEYLTARWLEHNAEAKWWTMWDLALVEAMISPEMATKKKVTTPPENTRREIWLYDSIDADAMRATFRKTVK